MTDAHDTAAIAHVLAHDVGKYVARAARNLPREGAIPKVLTDMLVRDLYAQLPSGPTPRDRFEVLAADLGDAGVDDARLAEVRARFEGIGPLREAIVSGDLAAIRSAAADALEIERSLSSLARDLSAAAGGQRS